MDFHFSSNWSSSWCVNARFPQFPRPCSPRSWARAGNLESHPSARAPCVVVSGLRKRSTPRTMPATATIVGGGLGFCMQMYINALRKLPSFAVRHRPPPPPGASIRPF